MSEFGRFGLQRFAEAQDGVWDQARAELRAGEKRTHWMWFIFPQLRGLGQSSMAVRYAIGSLAEAEAYLEHPVLGPRLRELTEVVVALEGRSVGQVFGYPDDLKFHSSMTLFAAASGGEAVFRKALDTYFDGRTDESTLRLLQSADGNDR